MKELGYDIEFYLWVGLFAPKATPEPIVTKIRDFTRAAVITPKFKELMANMARHGLSCIRPSSGPSGRPMPGVEDAVRSIGRVEG